MRAICVDDEKLITDYVVSLCRSLPPLTEAEGFTRARDALAWLKENNAELALLDIDMPDMNGIALAAEIKKLRPDTAIVFLTGFSEYAMKAFEVHASGYYRSPTQTLFAEREASYAINCGLRADFFDKKMSVHLNVNDIFNWNRWDNNTSNPYYISYSSFKFNSRSISAGITFRFGKMELERRAREGGEDSGDMPASNGK